MGLEVPEALVAVGGNPARERIQTAGEGAVGMNGAAPLPEEDAPPIGGACQENRPAGLGIAGKEVGRADAEPA
jgi:hypothetical protein